MPPSKNQMLASSPAMSRGAALSTTSKVISVLSVRNPHHTDHSSKQAIQAYLTVIGGFLYMTFLGCQYVVGTIAPYLASYYGVSSTETSLILPFIFITNIFVMPFGGQLAQKYHPKLLIAVGATIGLSMILLSITVTSSFYPFLALFSIGFGFCNGLTYMVPMQHGWLWFPERPGLISGIIIGGFGIGTFVFSLVCKAIVNPGNAEPTDGKYPDEVDEQVPKMMLTLCISCMGIAAVAFCLIFPGKDPTSTSTVKETVSRTMSQMMTSQGGGFESEGQVPQFMDFQKKPTIVTEETHSRLRALSDSESFVVHGSTVLRDSHERKIAEEEDAQGTYQMREEPLIQSVPEEALSLKQAPTVVQFVNAADPTQISKTMDLDHVVLTDKQKLRLAAQCAKTSIFWKLYTMQTLSILLGYYIVNSYKNFGETVPTLNNDEFLTLVSSISALFNAARFVWSGALDKLCFKKVYGVLLIMQITLAFTIKLTEQSRASYAIMVCLTLFCIGGHFALFPNVLKQIFGKQATVLYGLCFTGTGLASLFIIGLVLSPIGKSYYILFYIMGTLSFVSLCILTFAFKQERFEPDWPLILDESDDKSTLESTGSLETDDLSSNPMSVLSSMDQKSAFGQSRPRQPQSSLFKIKRDTILSRRCASVEDIDEEDLPNTKNP